MRASRDTNVQELNWSGRTSVEKISSIALEYLLHYVYILNAHTNTQTHKLTYIGTFKLRHQILTGRQESMQVVLNKHTISNGCPYSHVLRTQTLRYLCVCVLRRCWCFVLYLSSYSFFFLFLCECGYHSFYWVMPTYGLTKLTTTTNESVSSVRVSVCPFGCLCNFKCTWNMNFHIIWISSYGRILVWFG